MAKNQHIIIGTKDIDIKYDHIKNSSMISEGELGIFSYDLKTTQQEA